MDVRNIGNTTVRNPRRLREALELFSTRMEGRPFRLAEQIEFQGHMIDAGLVKSGRYDGDDGGRKFGSAFKQLGFVTDWSHGKDWKVTPVGHALIQHPALEETIFLRQLLKYQITSPLEDSRTARFHLRPFWLILRLLKRAHEAGLIGFTKVEIGLFVITVLTDDDASFEMAFTNIREFRAAYDALSGKVAKNRFADERFRAKADMLNLKVDTFGDYADSNGRYALMSGLLTLRSNKLAVAESRLPYINALLTEQSRFVDDDKEYLAAYYDPEKPILPTDNMVFLRHETVMLSQQLRELRGQITGSSQANMNLCHHQFSLPHQPSSNIRHMSRNCAIN